MEKNPIKFTSQPWNPEPRRKAHNIIHYFSMETKRLFNKVARKSTLGLLHLEYPNI
jgi:hypothetical protein